MVTKMHKWLTRHPVLRPGTLIDYQNKPESENNQSLLGHKHCVSDKLV